MRLASDLHFCKQIATLHCRTQSTIIHRTICNQVAYYDSLVIKALFHMHASRNYATLFPEILSQVLASTFTRCSLFGKFDNLPAI